MSNKVVMKLVGEDGNAFAIMGRFSGAARRAGWKQEEIDAVLKEATSGDYNHLLATIAGHVEQPDNENPWDDEEDGDE